MLSEASGHRSSYHYADRRRRLERMAGIVSVPAF